MVSHASTAHLVLRAEISPHVILDRPAELITFLLNPTSPLHFGRQTTVPPSKSEYPLDHFLTLKAAMAAATPPIRALQRLSLLPMAHTQRSAFATSSRVGLDFTRPSRASTTGTSTYTYTTTESAGAAARQGASSAPSFPSATRARAPPHMAAPHLNPNASPASDNAGSGNAFMTKAERAAAEKLKVRFAPYNDPDGPDPRLPYSHVLTLHGSKNNLRLTFSDRIGVLCPPISGGIGQVFKKGRRRDFESGTQAAVKAFTEMERVINQYNSQYGPDPSRNRVQSGVSKMSIKLVVVSSGQRSVGFEGVKGALIGPEGSFVRQYITMVEDRTKVPIGGDRPRRKKRR